MKVVHVITKFTAAAWGGAENAILQVARGGRLLGIESEIYTTRALAPSMDEIIHGVRVRRFSFIYPPRRGLKATLEERIRRGEGALSLTLVWNLLWRRDVDLVHLHVHNKLSSSVALACRLRRIPYMITIHSRYSIEGQRGPGRLTFFSFENCLLHAERIICVGLDEYRVIKKLYPRKQVVWLPNGVDRDRYGTGDGRRFRHRYNIGPGPLILSVGRIYDVKNQVLLLEVFGELAERNSGVEVAIIGQPVDRDYFLGLQKMIVRKSWAHRVHIIPGLPPNSQELIDAYAACDTFVLPSKTEAMPLVILEAWAAGKPVVASRVGGVKDVVDHGEDGLLFNLGPHERKDLGNALQTLLYDSALRERLGEAGRKKVASMYNWSTVTMRLADLYRTVVVDYRAHRGCVV